MGIKIFTNKEKNGEKTRATIRADPVFRVDGWKNFCGQIGIFAVL